MGGKEPYWVTDHPLVVHERCRDWSSQPWPYEREFKGLRKMARELRELLNEVTDAGRKLAAQRRIWPPRSNGSSNPAARQIREGRLALERVRMRAKRLGIGTKWVEKR